MNVMGVEKDLYKAGIELRNKKNKMGFEILARYIKLLYSQIKFMLESIRDLYYVGYSNDNPPIVTHSGLTLDYCIEVVDDASKSLQKIRKEILSNYDPGSILMKLLRFEEEEIKNNYENNIGVLEKADKEGKNKDEASKRKK